MTTLRCLLRGHLWGPWRDLPDLGLDERDCQRRGCAGYDNRDDGTGWMERQETVEAIARLRASRPIWGDIPATPPKGARR